VAIRWASSGSRSKFLGDLLVREVQPHEVEDQHPDLERLVVAGEDGVGQVVEAAGAGSALVALSLRLGVIPALLDDVGRIAIGAADALGPAEVPDDLEALGIVDDRLDIEHRGAVR
jgi:hypothetical protein